MHDSDTGKPRELENQHYKTLWDIIRDCEDLDKHPLHDAKTVRRRLFELYKLAAGN